MTRVGKGLACAALFGGLIGAALSVPAVAAVGLCQPMAVAEESEAATEAEARQATLASWHKIAEGYGVAYTRWGIAWNRQIKCSTASSGRVKCQASAMPCRVEQVPPHPASVVRLKRTVPSAPPTEAPATAPLR